MIAPAWRAVRLGLFERKGFFWEDSMRSFNIGLALGACALALAACGGGDEKAEATKTETAGATPVGAPAAPKAGLWENTTQLEGQAANTVRMCVGEQAGDVLTNMGAPSEQICSERKLEPTAGGYALSLTCNLEGQGTLKSTGKITGDMTSNYTAESTTSVTVGDKTQTAKMSYTAKWLGPCPEGMNPGAIDYGNIIVDSSGMQK